MTEIHPFKPFLPENAKVLLLGSFPPQPKRWSIDFYYPNFINDMWRITGLLFFEDKDFFIKTPLLSNGAKAIFDKEKIISFCENKGIAMYDTATEIIRLKDNASDKFLEVVTTTDIDALIKKIPDCNAIVTTGQKATDILASKYRCGEPPIGQYVNINIGERHIKFYRLPSTSRAYPLALVKKAEYYRKMYQEIGLL